MLMITAYRIGSTNRKRWAWLKSIFEIWRNLPRFTNPIISVRFVLVFWLFCVSLYFSVVYLYVRFKCSRAVSMHKSREFFGWRLCSSQCLGVSCSWLHCLDSNSSGWWVTILPTLISIVITFFFFFFNSIDARFNCDGTERSQFVWIH